MVKYILAKTTGKIEIGNDGYPVGELRPEKAPSNVTAEYKRYSPDQTKVIIKCYDDIIDAKAYGDNAKEVTEAEARTLCEQWQDEWDAKCTCFGKNHTHATQPELNRPCLAGNLGGVCHEVIDESKPKDTKDFDKWKKDFEKKPRADFEEEGKKHIKHRKENEILDIATKIKSDSLLVKAQLDSIHVTAEEINAEIDKIIEEEIEDHKYRLIKHPLKTYRVAF
jgi:hypothetical protein